MTVVYVLWISPRLGKYICNCRGVYPLVPDEGPQMNNSIASIACVILVKYLLNFIIQS